MKGAQRVLAEIRTVLEMKPAESYASLMSYLGVCEDLAEIHRKLVDYQADGIEDEEKLLYLENEVHRCREFLVKNGYVSL